MEHNRDTSVLIPELPSEVALNILVRLPHLVQARLRLVCRAWRDAMEPAAMSLLRKVRHISEVWPVTDLHFHNKLYDNKSASVFTVVDPFLHRTHKISHPPQLRNHASCLNFVVLNNVGYEVLIAVLPVTSLPAELALELQGLYSFDGLQMKWKDFKYSSLPPSLELAPPADILSLALFYVMGLYMDNRYLYVVGVYSCFERLDLKTKMWETLPHPLVHRRKAAVVMLKELFYMIGGLYVNDFKHIYSGEIWDPVSGKWTLVPELCPYEVFERGLVLSRVAVVMDLLYALRRVSTSFYEELMYYETSSKLWIFLGYIPLRGNCCLFGMDQELWVVKERGMTVLASKPSLSPPLSWRTVVESSETTLSWNGAMLV